MDDDNFTGTDSDYYSNSTDMQPDHISLIGHRIMNYVYCVIFAVGVTGNVWVFFLIGRNRLTKAVTNIFIINLAIADLFLLLFLPIIVAYGIITEWIFGMFMCKLYYTCEGINKFASIMFLVLLSVDRYLAVCHPVASRSIRTVRVAFGMVAGSWILVILLMIPVFMYTTLLLNIDAMNRTTIQCAIYWSQDQVVADRSRLIFSFYTFSISYLVPLVLIWSFYLLILNRLRRQEKLFNYSKTSNAYRSTTMIRRRRSSRRVSIMVLTIVIAYTICWMPYWLVQIGLELFDEHIIYSEWFTLFSLIAYGLEFTNSALNPFLYAFGTGSYRQECMRKAGGGNPTSNAFSNQPLNNLTHHHSGRDSMSSFTSLRLTNNIRRESHRSSSATVKDKDQLGNQQPLLDPYYVQTKRFSGNGTVSQPTPPLNST